MVESLDADSLTEIDRACVMLAQQRADEIRAGKASSIPAQDVLKEARRSLGE